MFKYPSPKPTDMDCICGNPILKSHIHNQAAVFFEEDYCSRYCREFDLRGLEKVDKSTISGYEGHKNQMSYPSIFVDCDVCGEPAEMKKGAGGSKGNNRIFCSNECYGQIKTFPKVRKSLMVYSMLRLLRHVREYGQNDGWLTSNDINTMMQKRFVSAKNPWPMILRRWTANGMIEKRSISHLVHGKSQMITEYRLAEQHMTGPLGKHYMEAA